MTTDNRHAKKIGWETLLVAGLLILTFFPFLGENLFSTKGEPREAVVAVSMLNSGNWILPVTFGSEIPYKPPMLAWCIALLGSLNGGTVTEFLSRVPSALSAVIMILVGFRLYARRMSVPMAVAMALITAGFFELFRSSTICRVDMLLTMFTVTALYSFFRQWTRNPEGTWHPSLAAVLLMSGGVLTKGPVGMLLPCMVAWVFRLMKGGRFWQTTASVGLSGILSLILPAIWYIAAYRQGGDTFLQLVMEENFGRFTGSMSYESHENPAWYNLLTLSYGCLPYTLLPLMSLFCIPALRRARRKDAAERGERITLWQRFRRMDPLELFSLLALVLIFVFYCIPKSKRSVYLLPVYPFMACFIAMYVRWLLHRLPGLVRTYCWVICLTGLLASAAVFAVLLGAASGADDGGSLGAVFDYMSETSGRQFMPVALALFSTACAIMLAREILFSSARVCFGWTMIYTLVIYWMVSGSVLPAVMNVKTDKWLAMEIESFVPEGAGMYVYRYDPQGIARYYMLDYYLSDRLGLFDVALPDEGYLVVGEDDFNSHLGKMCKEYCFIPVFTSKEKCNESRQRLELLRFERKR